MDWFIKKGDDIKRDQTMRFHFFRSLDHDYTEGDLIFYCTLWECQDRYCFKSFYSTSLTDIGVRIAPKYPSEDKLVKENCCVRADLTSVPRSYLVRRIGLWS